jgi:NAD(P)-dependent dehydrogenase (short-subunit alcohol dehydrogenase family)
VSERSEQRVLIVGGSSGIGAATAQRLAARGARVVIAGRRADALAEVAERVGGDTATVVCDVTVEESIRAALPAAAAVFDGLDAVIYAPADLRLVQMEDATAADWQASFASNVVGASLVTSASLPYLRASTGRMIYLSSDVVDFPRSGLGLYGCTKRALEGLCIQFRLEVPEVRFTTLTCGPSRPTSLGRVEDWPKFPGYEERWLVEGMHYRGEADVDEVAEILEMLLATRARVDELRVEPPGGGPH